MTMTKAQKEAILASVAKSIVATLQNSRKFAYKVNDAVNEAVKDAIDVSVEDEVNEAIENIVEEMDWGFEIDDLDLSDIDLEISTATFAVNRELTYMVTHDRFFGGHNPENLEELVAFMKYSCEDVSFLEHAKRIVRMDEILRNL